MKATELMIGDLVEVKNYGVKEVIGIKEFDGVIEISENKDSEVEIPYDDVSPIPLTPEILEKNGLGLKGQDMPIISLKIQGDGWWNKPCAYIKYVHEFQHALRLCGLNELADDFKIND
mgnify:CR=1 FL=1